MIDKTNELFFKECNRLVQAARLRGINCSIIQPKGEAPEVNCPGHPEMEVCPDSHGKFDIWYWGSVNPIPLIFGLTVDDAAELIATVSSRENCLTQEEIKSLLKYNPPEDQIYSGSREPNETDDQYQQHLIAAILSEK